MKKIYTVLFLFITLFAASCSSDDDTPALRLDTPVPVLAEASSSEAVVTWEAIPHAASYVCQLNDAEEVPMNVPSITLSQLLPEVEYRLKVKAVADSGESSAWGELVFSLEKASFKVEFPENGLKAYSVTFSLTPDNAEERYYFNFISKERWESEGAEQMQSEFVQSVQGMADLMGSTFEEALERIMYRGALGERKNEAGFRANTDFYIYAFYWDNETNSPSKDIFLHEFRTPAPVVSAETIEVSFEEVGWNTMSVVLTPSANVKNYYYYFAPTVEVDKMLAELGEEAFVSYEAMNRGLRLEGTQRQAQVTLAPDTEYTVLMMGVDADDNRFVVRKSQKTAVKEESGQVESELFTQLLGEWEGTQTINDMFAGTSESKFTVRIVAQVEDHDYDYRAANQLVALVDGWNNLEYYGIAGLIEQGIENPADKFGPKWLLNIAEGDVVTIDGKGQHSVIGWLFYGDCYLFNMTSDGATIDKEHDLQVEVSADKNTLVISSPAGLEGHYPGMAYNMQGLGWMSMQNGASDIVLTRKQMN